MKKIFITFLCSYLFLCANENCFSQVSQTNGDKLDDTQQRILQKKYAAYGTYQFICKDKNSMELFTTDILIEIEKNRDEKEIKYIKAGKATTIKILPYAVINSKGFVPLEEYAFEQK